VRRRGWQIVLGVMVAWLLNGCATKLPKVTPIQESRLARMLMTLDRSVDPVEARRLAHEALTYSGALAKRYRVETSPWVHNFLVNVGLKKRGLCYQWADDLRAHLAHLHLKTLTLYPVGANIGDYWKEHNALAVLPTHHVTPLAYGILLDPWRHAGKLYFSPIEQDTKYHWQVRQERMGSYSGK